jgi:hypothetical protein
VNFNSNHFFYVSVGEADETIRNTLDMLNVEYPVGDLDSVNAAPHSTDAQSGTPVYDETPMAERPHVTVPVSESVEWPACPIFDSTPMRQDIPKADNAVCSPVFDSTPVWQDTQSQSVDGTEEVTQEHMVAEQIANYNAQHASRVSKFKENLFTYYRKKASKSKKADGSSACDAPKLDTVVDNAESPCVQPSSNDPLEAPCPKRQRIGVIMRKAAPGEPLICSSPSPSRRSPRFVANETAVGSSSKVSTPGKSNLVKRRRVSDETYVPDAANVAAVDDEDDDKDDDIEPPAVEVRVFPFFY